MARVLLIDDDRALLRVLSLALTDADHQVETAVDGAEGLRIAERSSPEVIVSDVNMPALDGFSLVRKLRDRSSEIPVILLTSRDSDIDESLGLDLGADDYLVKPASTRVLLARISALLRRQRARSAVAVAKHSVLRVGRVELDRERMTARLGGTAFAVTVTEFRYLDTFLSRPGTVFSREQLLAAAHPGDSDASDRVVDTYVRRLRRKLEVIDPACALLETVIGAGYRWKLH